MTEFRVPRRRPPRPTRRGAMATRWPASPASSAPPVRLRAVLLGDRVEGHRDPGVRIPARGPPRHAVARPMRGRLVTGRGDARFRTLILAIPAMSVGASPSSFPLSACSSSWAPSGSASCSAWRRSCPAGVGATPKGEPWPSSASPPRSCSSNSRPPTRPGTSGIGTSRPLPPPAPRHLCRRPGPASRPRPHRRPETSPGCCGWEYLLALVAIGLAVGALRSSGSAVSSREWTGPGGLTPLAPRARVERTRRSGGSPARRRPRRCRPFVRPRRGVGVPAEIRGEPGKPMNDFEFRGPGEKAASAGAGRGPAGWRCRGLLRGLPLRRGCLSAVLRVVRVGQPPRPEVRAAWLGAAGHAAARPVRGRDVPARGGRPARVLAVVIVAILLGPSRSCFFASSLPSIWRWGRSASCSVWRRWDPVGGGATPKAAPWPSWGWPPRRGPRVRDGRPVPAPPRVHRSPARPGPLAGPLAAEVGEPPCDRRRRPRGRRAASLPAPTSARTGDPAPRDRCRRRRDPA